MQNNDDLVYRTMNHEVIIHSTFAYGSQDVHCYIPFQQIRSTFRRNSCDALVVPEVNQHLLTVASNLFVFPTVSNSLYMTKYIFTVFSRSKLIVLFLPQQLLLISNATFFKISQLGGRPANLYCVHGPIQFNSHEV